MISGAHIIISSTNAEADRAFFKDVLKYKNVDAGAGWLIFKLPPAEVAVHPDKENDSHELYLMCDDLKATMADLKKSRVACDKPMDLPWGKLTYFKLPGGGRLGLYQPKHPLAHSLKATASRKSAPARPKKSSRARK
jgi:hypothetical protein